MARGLETLAVFERFCRANDLAGDDVHVVATSAIRDAENGAEFLSEAERATGMKIETLSAEDEAFFGYVAAVNTTTLTDGVVLDLGRRQHAADPGARPPRGRAGLVSARRGAHDRAVPARAGPAKKKELTRLREYVASELSGLDWLSSSGSRLVGIGGAVRNLAAAVQSSDGGHRPGGPGVRHQARRTRGADRDPGRTLSRGSRQRWPASSPAAATSSWPRPWSCRWCSSSAASTASRSPRLGSVRACSWPRPCSDGQEPLFPDVRQAAVRNLAIQYESDLKHVEHVARLALQMFDSLVAQGLFEPRDGERELLWAASMLHDVGHDDLLRRSPQALAVPDRDG